MEKKKTVRISQCMIVKNEESSIEKALSWGKEIMWEQIVVDTGSTDRTAELAAGLGASVYHFPWTDDFAAAKNFAAGKAQGDRRRIHEQLVRLDGTPLRVADGTRELSILHSGYSRNARKKKDTNRNLKLIQKELEEHSDDYEMLGYLGDEYYAAGDLAGAEDSYRESITHMPAVLDERDQRSAATFLYLLQIRQL